MSSNRVGPPPPSEPSRGGGADSKKFREELQKVQKIKEVDPDEQTRKRNKRFAAQMGDEDKPEDLNAAPRKASPFEVSFHLDKPAAFKSPPSLRSKSSIDASANTAVPSPSYSPPPHLESGPQISSDDDRSSMSLPNSDRFWQDVDLPDQPLPPQQNFTETSRSQANTHTNQERKNQPPQKGKGKKSKDQDQELEPNLKLKIKAKEKEPSPFGIPGKPQELETTFPSASVKKGNESRLTTGGEEEEEALGIPSPEPMLGKKPEKISPFALPTEKSAKEASSPFGAPDKISEKKSQGAKPTPWEEPPKTAKPLKRAAEQQFLRQAPEAESLKPSVPLEKKDHELPLSLPFTRDEEIGKPRKAQAPDLKEVQESVFNPDLMPQAPIAPLPQEKAKTPTSNKPGSEEAAPTASLLGPLEKSGEREGGGGGKRQQFQHAAVHIVQPSLPQLAPNVQPMAEAATQQAAPYLTPETMSLFYQMVGMIYVMTAPSGVSRTEILLNAPAFSSSKFYGSTITIEKYATAPDSLNIRLTGSNEAVQAFNQNISSLIAAFQNGNFRFRIGRIEAAYSVDKPVFRRKGQGEGKDSGGFEDRKR